MNPKEYELKEIKDVEFELIDVDYNMIGSVNLFTATYIPKEKYIRKCSFCNKLRIVYSIEGREPLSNKGRINNKVRARNIYHQTFYIICEGCAVARKI